MQTYYFYPKYKFQVREKIWLLYIYIGMQRYYKLSYHSKFNIEILGKPWKSNKVYNSISHSQDTFLEITTPSCKWSKTVSQQPSGFELTFQ